MTDINTVDDYYSKFYTKEAKRFQMLSANDNAKAKEIAAWKEEVVEKWDSIEVVSCEKTEELVKGSIESGKEYTITYVIDEKGLNDAVGLELVKVEALLNQSRNRNPVKEPFCSIPMLWITPQALFRIIVISLLTLKSMGSSGSGWSVPVLGIFHSGDQLGAFFGGN